MFQLCHKFAGMILSLKFAFENTVNDCLFNKKRFFVGACSYQLLNWNWALKFLLEFFPKLITKVPLFRSFPFSFIQINHGLKQAQGLIRTLCLEKFLPQDWLLILTGSLTETWALYASFQEVLLFHKTQKYSDGSQ